MLFMLLRRIVLGAVTVCLVSLIIFAGVEILPGDACTQFLGEYQADDELLAQCRKDLDLNRPAFERFTEWTQGALTGDLGVAADGKTKISTIVGDPAEKFVASGILRNGRWHSNGFASGYHQRPLA